MRPGVGNTWLKVAQSSPGTQNRGRGSTQKIGMPRREIVHFPTPGINKTRLLARRTARGWVTGSEYRLQEHVVHLSKAVAMGLLANAASQCEPLGRPA